MCPKQPKINRMYKLYLRRNFRQRRAILEAHEADEAVAPHVSSANSAERVPRLKAKSPDRTW